MHFGMGLLFIVIGTFSGAIAALPRSGGWMYILENIFGVAIITVALYFLKDVFSPVTHLAPEFYGLFRHCRGVGASWCCAR